jgi:hypothetical protein
MRMISIVCLLTCGLATTAQAQNVPPQPMPAGLDTATMQNQDQPVPWQQQPQGMTLAQKCALASAYIKAGNCGPQGCDIGLCVTLQNGCRINHWGHSCPWTGRQ